MMEREWRAILARYGQEMTLHHKTGERHLVRAFFQPVLDKGEEQEVPSPLGLRREERFLYLGPGSGFLEPGDEVERLGRRYRVQSAHPVGGGAVHHWWAVLRPEEETL